MQAPASALFGWRVTKQPVVRAVRRLDAVVVTDELRFASAHPPFAVDTLRTICLRYPITNVAPHKEPRRMIRQFGDGLDSLRPREQSCRARQMLGPIETLRRTKCRDAANSSLW